MLHDNSNMEIKSVYIMHLKIGCWLPIMERLMRQKWEEVDQPVLSFV